MRPIRRHGPLRFAGAAFVFGALQGCAPVAPYHVPESHPSGLSQAMVGHFQAMERGGLKVLLRRGSAGLKLSCQGGVRLLDGGGRTLAEFGPGEKAQLLASRSELTASGRGLGVAEALLKAIQPGQAVKVGGTAYRGNLLLKASGDALLLVNEVSLDDYLCGVLPGEVGADWPQEALRAQAVAARTYAVFRAQGAASKLFDLDDSTRSQVYFGTSKEAPKSSAAVEATSGLILAWQGRPAEAFFHANCGGHTADAAGVWGSALPYLRGVEDPFCEEGTHFAWRCEIDHDALLSRLAKAGIKLRDFDSVIPLDRDASGRWGRVRLEGNGVNEILGAQAFRAALGPEFLRSTNFQWSRHGDTHRFEGRGWGHGVGLCQEGAKAMAAAGYRFRDILSHYFPGARVKRLSE